MTQQVVLIRHAETEWSQAGRHTGITDLPLLEEGRRRSLLIGAALRVEAVGIVLTSPLLRARQTCELAGFGATAKVREELTEWDYGEYEGLTTAQIREKDAGWLLWRDGAPGGESPEQVQARADTLVRELQSRPAAPANVLVFAHGHLLQALALRWVGVALTDGPLFALDTGSICRLGWKRETPVITTWNDTAHLRG